MATGAAINDWLRTFIEAAAMAVEQSQKLGNEISALRRSWTERLTARRSDVGLRAAPRADSAVARLLIHRAWSQRLRSS